MQRGLLGLKHLSRQAAMSLQACNQSRAASEYTDDETGLYPADDPACRAAVAANLCCGLLAGLHRHELLPPARPALPRYACCLSPKQHGGNPWGCAGNDHPSARFVRLSTSGTCLAVHSGQAARAPAARAAGQTTLNTRNQWRNIMKFIATLTAIGAVLSSTTAFAATAATAVAATAPATATASHAIVQACCALAACCGLPCC